MFDPHMLLIESTKKLLWLRRQGHWAIQLPRRCPPILWFGNARSPKPKVLTIGANPSRQEYLRDSSQQALDKVAASGDESLLDYLEPPDNRFHVLDAANERLEDIVVGRDLREAIIQGYNDYFSRNPYQKWFGHPKDDSYKVEGFLRGLGASYYDNAAVQLQAIHIDLLPFATLSDFGKLKKMTGELLEPGWAKEMVTALIRFFRPAVLVAFGRTNVNVLDAHIDSSLSCLPWHRYEGTSYQVGLAEQLEVPFVGLSVNLGNPRGFDSEGLRRFGCHVHNLIRMGSVESSHSVASASQRLIGPEADVATSQEARRTQRRLDRLFARAKSQFFPDWDVDQQWQIVAGCRQNSDGETGYCSSKEKRIYIDPQEVNGMPEDGLLAFIIHEICHDAATAYHTERWVKRMEKAAQRAEELDLSQLARHIRTSAYGHIPLEKPWAEKWCKYLYAKTDLD